MTAQNDVTLVAAILAFIASVLAAAVSIYNARFTRFARERWWERKVDAYSRIIEALAALVYYYEEHYDAELEHRELTDDHRKEIADYWRRGYTEVKRATAIGAFLVSPEADAVLQKMSKDKGKGGHPGDWFSVLESDYVDARDSLRAVVSAAKKDLRVPWH